MKINAGKFCSYTGMKSDTLRFYVDKGIIHPLTNQNNGYKLYSEYDLLNYFYVRQSRNMNIPIRQMRELSESTGLQEQLDYLHQYDAYLQNEKRILEEKIEAAAKLRKDIERIPYLSEHVIETPSSHGNDLAHLDLYGDGISASEAEFEIVRKWNRHFFRIFPYIRIPLKQLKERPEVFRTVMGIGAVLRNESDLRLVEAPAWIYQKSHSIGLMIKTTDPYNITSDKLNLIYDYARQNHYDFSNDATSWLITQAKEEEKTVWYFAIRCSVQQAE